MKQKSFVLLLSGILLLSGCTVRVVVEESPKQNAQPPTLTPTEPARQPEYTNPPVFPKISQKDYEADLSPEQVVESVRQRYYDIQSRMDTLKCRRDSNGVSRYYENGILRKITIPLGVLCETDFYFSREYYFDDQEMYFALLGNGTNELRFYFHDNQLIRMLYGDGDILDNARNHYAFTKYEGILLDEAEQMWHNKMSNERDDIHGTARE